MFNNDNEDPFTMGELFFEDVTLNEKFKKEYKEYCFSEEGSSEAYIYWVQTGN